MKIIFNLFLICVCIGAISSCFFKKKTNQINQSLSSRRPRITTTTEPPTSIAETREPSLAITDQGTVTDIISVSNTGILASIQVEVDITHPVVSDLVIRLIAPDSTPVVLYNRLVGPANILTTFPSETFMDFTDIMGLSINGDWTLEITDSSNGNQGTLNSWSLAFSLNYGPFSSLVKEKNSSTSIRDFTPFNDTLTVTEIGKIVTVQVHIDITHTCIQDLDVKLISPDNTEVELERHSQANCVRDIRKDYPPSVYGSLFHLNTKMINGVWILYVKDNFNLDSGTLNSWTLTFNYVNI